jgi:hypothetical protein
VSGVINELLADKTEFRVFEKDCTIGNGDRAVMRQTFPEITTISQESVLVFDVLV